VKERGETEMSFIQVEQINKNFKDKTVLQNISLMLKEGKCYGFVGNNGSGKSMLLKSICGFVKTDSGRITVKGKEIIGGRQFIENAGVLIESPSWMNHLTGVENLQLLADIQGKISLEEINEALTLVGLTEVRNQKIRKYSLGMKQRLRIAQAIMEDPAVLVLDEPFNGLDKSGVQEMQALMMTYKEKGKTILLTSHDERQIEFLCDEVYELSGGELV